MMRETCACGASTESTGFKRMSISYVYVSSALLAEAAVAALDAYDKEHPQVVWAEYEALIKNSVEADLRERIAQEIEDLADEYRTHDDVDSLQGEVKDQLHEAARIARGDDRV